MNSESSTSKGHQHIGKKIEKVRMFLGIKQETLAVALGITQQAVSNIENKMVIEESLLGEIATVFGVSVEVIKNFDEEKAIYNINNYNYQDAKIEDGATTIVQQINPIDKIVELYERLLRSEREKIDLLLNNQK